MMKKLLLKTMLLLCALIAGSGTMWGDDETIASGTFDGKNGNYTTGWSTTGTGKNRNDCIIIGSGENITSPTMDLSKYSKVTISIKARRYGSLSGSKATIDASIGGVSVGTTDATGTNAATSLTDIEFEPTDTMTSVAIVFTCTNATSAGSSHGAGVNTITITGTPAAGGGDTPTLSDCDLALTGAPVALNFDLYNNSTAQTINYTTSSTGAVTIADNDYAEFDIDEENKTITVTPTAVTPSTQTITVIQAADETHNAGSATFTLTITDSTPIPTYTATFSVNGVITSTQDYEEGADIVFPVAPADVNGKKFVGWVTEAIDGTTDDAPDYVNTTTATMGESNITYYAVFATETGTPVAFHSYEKVTTAQADWSGTYLLGATYNGGTDDAKKGTWIYKAPASSGNYGEHVAIGELTTEQSDYEIVIANSTNGYTIYHPKSKKYFAYDASDNKLNFADAVSSKKQEWTITDVAVIKNANTTGRILLYNGSSPRFACYTGNQTATELYRRIESGGITYSGYCTTVAAAVAVTGVSVDATATVNVGETTTLTATVSPDNATNKNVTWASSDEAIATVDANGVVTGVAAGEATITVTSVADNTKTADCTVTVTAVAVTGITVDETASVNVGKTTTLTATVSPDNATNKNVTWESSDEAIATVDANGVVTGVAAGEATITVASVADNTKTASCTVTVSVAPGTAARPYTVAEAIDAIDNGGDVTDVYVKGVISQIDSYSSTYHSLTYWISADGTTEAQQFEVYSCKGIDGANFSSIDDLEIGDRVVVKGNIKKYNNIYEFDYNNQLVSRTEKPASDLAKTSDIDLDVKNNALTASIADYISSSSAGAYTYESADETVATVSSEGVVTGLKVGTTTITVNQAATLSYKAGTVEISVTVADTRVDATTIPAINISSLSTDDEGGTISVVDPVKADEGVTFSFESSDEDVLLIEGDKYFVIGIGTTTVTVTATASNSDLYKNVTKTFEVTVNAAVKSENVIAFDFESYSTEYGTNLEGVVGGSTGFDGEITATSSNPSVLTVAVDAEGNVTVTPVAVGSATVTFSAAETTSFLAAEDVQQVFTVMAPEGTAIAPANGFVKVTATEDITNGEYLIVYEDGEVAFDGSLETLDATDNTIDVEITDGVIAATNDTKAATFTIDVTAGTIQSKSGYYIGMEVNSNGLDSNAATQYTHSFKIDETGDAVITASGNCVLKYNSGSNQNRFRYYKSGQQDIQLYKLTEATATITLNTSGYATFCSQYPLDFSTAAGYTAWQITAIEGETITFGKITGTIKGGQGILLKGEAGETITLTSADSEKELNDNLLFGTTAPTYIAANEYYGLSGNKFVKVNAGTVPAGKALLPATAIPAGARELKLVFEDENTTTGIRTIENAEMRTENAVYDLQGRKVTKPVKGGLYIENGLKFVKK